MLLPWHSTELRFGNSLSLAFTHFCCISQPSHTMIGSTWMKVLAVPCLLLVATVAVMYLEPSEPSINSGGQVELQSTQRTQSLALFKHAALEDVYVYAGKEEHTRHLVPFICRLIKRHRFRLNIHQVQHNPALLFAPPCTCTFTPCSAPACMPGPPWQLLRFSYAFFAVFQR